MTTLTSFKGRPLSYLALSDIHLGARSTTASEIIEHLTLFFGDFSYQSPYCELDAIFIAGDLWDDTVEFSSEVIQIFIPFLRRFLAWAVRHDIVVRILEGTPKHDRRQGKTIEAIVESFKLEGLDFRYVPELSIETCKGLGDLTILYVPDECRPTADDVKRDVQALLDENELDKVDIAIMHGMFKFQVGMIPDSPKVHEEAWYLEKVRHYISIGHIHVSSQYSRILPQGSFDRLSHGEEGPKGGYLIKRTDQGDWLHFFVENKHAKIYKTVKIEGEVEACLAKIDTEIKSLPLGSHVRIQAEATHPLLQGIETLKQKYPLFTFTKKPVSATEVSTTEEVIGQDYVPVVLNRDTLTEAVYTDITGNETLSEEDERALYALLESLHD